MELEIRDTPMKRKGGGAEVLKSSGSDDVGSLLAHDEDEWGKKALSTHAVRWLLRGSLFCVYWCSTSRWG